MKTPIDVVKGRVLDIDERGEVTIKVKYDDWVTFIKRGYKECLVQMIDSRPLSDKQRKACYALLREIADYLLSNAPMSLVCAFQRYLVRFILDWDIPCRFPLLNFVNDVQDYVYSCLVNKKCCVCGKHTQLHHVDHVGIGRNREEIIHEGMEAMPLCAEHHKECHTLGQQTFNDKYHFEGGIELDKTLCRIYGLERHKEVKQ